MPRTALTKNVGLLRNPVAGTLLVWTAADTVNFNSFAMSGNDLLLAWNTGASPYTVTVTSTPDPNFGRTASITAETIVAGTIRSYSVIQIPGWQQTDGTLWFQASNVAVQFAVIALP